MAKLVVKYDERLLGEYVMDAEVTVGRSPDNTITIDNPAVSGHHARIMREASDYVIEDLRSTNGTYVNRKHVTREPLYHRDVVLIGKHTLVFDAVGDAKPVSSPGSAPTLGKTTYLNTRKHRELLAKLRAERDMPAKEFPPTRRSGARLRVIDGRCDRPEYWIEDRISFIGKASEALVWLQGWRKPKTAAAIVLNDAGYTVTDFDGQTLVNGQPLPDGSQTLKDGDVLEVGGLVMQFSMSAAGVVQMSTVAKTA